MYKYLLFFFLLPYYLTAQEQVSDIKNYGLTITTDVSKKIGFTMIDSVQYVLKISDSLIIYRLENEKLVFHGAIKKLPGGEDSYDLLSPNRSLVKIENGIYYRFYKKGLQAIDIKKATLIGEYDFSSYPYQFIIPLEIYNGKYTFTPTLMGNRNVYVLDLVTREVTKLDVLKSRNNLIHKYNKIASIGSSSNIYFYDVDTKVDSLIHQAANGVNYFSYSPQDSSYNFLDNNNTLWKIDKYLAVKNTNCTLPIKNLKHMALNGNKAILITETKVNVPQVDSIIVYDISTCGIDLAFRTEKREFDHITFEFISNEYGEKNISIFGNYGHTEDDGPIEGLYYVINQNNNTAIPIKDISRIKSFTPFVHNNTLYCVAVNASGWSSHEYLLKMDLQSKAITKQSPLSTINNTAYISLGFHSGGAFYLATNDFDENPSLWSLKNNTDFSLIQEIDFSQNLGVKYIDKLIPLDQRLFFTCNYGLYSMLDDCRLESSFNNTAKLQWSGLNKQIAAYENKVALAEVSNQKIVFRIFDGQIGSTDSLLVKTNGARVAAGIGPYIFFYPTNNSNKLKYFDLKTNKILNEYTLADISTNGLTLNGNGALYSPSGGKVYLLDFENNNFDSLSIDVQAYKKVFPGYDGSYYIIEYPAGFDSTRIRLITKNKAISTIYNGPGYFEYGAKASNGNATLLVFSKNGNFIVSNDLVNTYLPTINKNSYLDLLQTYKNKFIFRLKSSEKNEYWLYESSKPLVKLMDGTSDNIVITSMNDSLAFFVTGNKNYSIIKYNLITNQIIYNKSLKTDYIYSNLRNPLKINDHQFLLHSSSDKGFEPAILDLDSANITLLKDINPGTASSTPSNFIKYKNWVYFTADIEDLSTQWFRINAGVSLPTIEQVTDSIGLTVFPSPASQEIMIDKDLEEVSIFGTNGQSLFQTKDYKSDQRINVSHFSNGTYYVIGSNKTNHFSGKVVVVH